MNIGFITNIRAPYRSLQLSKYSELKNMNLTVYYTNKTIDNREWEIKRANGFEEVDLDGIKISNRYGYINKGILNIIKQNDIIILGGYEQPTMIIISLLCRLFKKKYILVFDGISTNRLIDNEKKIKKIVKQIIINNSSAIMANGKVGKLYFKKIYNYPEEKIYNQYLTVDGDIINKLSKNKDIYRKNIREKMGISEDDKVLIYSGRLVSIKNVDSVIKAISKIDKKDIILLVAGGGELENELIELANSLNVRIIVTGFINEQTELFKHYFAGDALILPSSVYEVWGLVINEAMYAGLPVLVSNICGCSLDLVNHGENGYLFNPNDISDIYKYIKKLLYEDDYVYMGKKSKEIISKWNFEESKNEFEKMINYIIYDK